jgi:hypothetical protein
VLTDRSVRGIFVAEDVELLLKVVDWVAFWDVPA